MYKFTILLECSLQGCSAAVVIQQHSMWSQRNSITACYGMVLLGGARICSMEHECGIAIPHTTRHPLLMAACLNLCTYC